MHPEQPARESTPSMLMLCALAAVAAGSRRRVEDEDVRELCCTPDAEAPCQNIQGSKFLCLQYKSQTDCHRARIGTRPCVWEKGKCLKGWTKGVGHTPECPGRTFEARRADLNPDAAWAMILHLAARDNFEICLSAAAVAAAAAP